MEDLQVGNTILAHLYVHKPHAHVSYRIYIHTLICHTHTTSSHTCTLITCLHNYMHTQGFIWGECGQGTPLSESSPPPPLRICKFYASLVMPPKLFHTGGLKLPLLAALGLSNLTPEQMALLGPALSSQLGNSKLL